MRILKIQLLVILSLLWGMVFSAQQVRIEENFDGGWLFARYGLQPDGTSKPEPESGTTQSLTFNDSKWRKLNLPHDWGIEGPFRTDLDGYTGKLPWKGIGWYRKHFKIALAEKGKQFYVDFDGAMANAEVWLNGNKIGERPYGYSSFRVDLTPYILLGKENIIAVRLNTEKLGSRWYPGAGIYRHVRLVKTNAVHVAQWGAFVTTPEITAEKGRVKIELKVANHLSKTVDINYAADIYELSSNDQLVKKVATSSMQSMKLQANGLSTDTLRTDVPHPLLWSLEQTHRYLARIRVYNGNQLLDEYDTPFGFRTITFTHDNGFLLNGKRVQLQGTCNHHDLGALGAAMNIHALERQLRILKDMGCNALRTSHNPPAPELLTLADKMGFLVMDEAFDCWATGKNPNDYGTHYQQWHERDLEMLVCRDRNHPAVILWSTGNEVDEEYYPEKGLARHLTDVIHQFDTTHPVTFGASYPSKSGMNGTELQVDVHGMNYAAGVYGGPNFYGEFLRKKGHEKLAAYASETSSTMSSRGEYFPGKFQVSSYDTWAPGWGSLADDEFAALDRYPAIAGEFVWTGFDYLGEPTPFNSDASVLLNFAGLSKEQQEKEKAALLKTAENRPPSRSSYFGMVDLAGFPKDRYYLYQARWRPDFPMVHILPHWNFPERIGKVTPVYLYTSGDEAELFLNGKSLGRKKKKPFEYRLKWEEVKYEPGELKAVAYKQGKEWASSTVKTTGPAARLQLTADKSEIQPDGTDLVFVTIAITDKDGNKVPTANQKISCKVIGDGEIEATDNGDATCLVPFSSPVRPAFNGLMLAIIKTKAHASGKIKLVVESPGLENAENIIHVVR
ncbi:beta-galactosidase GalB [Pedobacter nutrimenti]|uniref:beta-galactosidase GalB n=1 Tax=Pedobacter nutrimenti TaxID=1241337 RepID=UPI00292D0E5B|nr:beta-galactosidase GalB [Pedobacter nutrimenti]